MPDNVTSCSQIRARMFETITDSLSVGMRDGFDVHLGGCNSCRDEFHRVQTLLQTIDRTLSARLAAEPSPQLVSNVRKNIRQNIPQSINAHPHGSTAGRRWSAWATAAGLCTAFALLLFVAHTSRKLSPPLHDSTTVQTRVSSTSKLISHPTLNPSVDASTQRRKPVLDHVLHTSLHSTRRNAAKPEIIVEPGQMQAILRFAVAMQHGQIDGAQFLAAQKKASEPLEIKPLPITPLKIEPLDADSAAPNSGNGENSKKSFVSGRSD